MVTHGEAKVGSEDQGRSQKFVLGVVYKVFFGGGGGYKTVE